MVLECTEKIETCGQFRDSKNLAYDCTKMMVVIVMVDNMDLVVVDFVDTDQSNHRVCGMDLILTMARNGRTLIAHNLIGILVLEILMVIDTLILDTMVMIDTLILEILMVTMLVGKDRIVERDSDSDLWKGNSSDLDLIRMHRDYVQDTMIVPELVHLILGTGWGNLVLDTIQ